MFQHARLMVTMIIVMIVMRIVMGMAMVRDDGERAMLFQLDNDVQRLAAEKGSNDATVVSLTGIYHNLLRRWADA